MRRIPRHHKQNPTDFEAEPCVRPWKPIGVRKTLNETQRTSITKNIHTEGTRRIWSAVSCDTIDVLCTRFSCVLEFLTALFPNTKCPLLPPRLINLSLPHLPHSSTNRSKHTSRFSSCNKFTMSVASHPLIYIPYAPISLPRTWSCSIRHRTATAATYANNSPGLLQWTCSQLVHLTASGETSHQQRLHCVPPCN